MLSSQLPGSDRLGEVLDTGPVLTMPAVAVAIRLDEGAVAAAVDSDVLSRRHPPNNETIDTTMTNLGPTRRCSSPTGLE